MSSSSDSDSSFFSSFFSAAGAAAAPPPAAAGAPDGAPPPAGIEDSFSRPDAISSSIDLPFSSLTILVTRAESASMPTELRIFSMSAFEGASLPPSTARRYAAT
uniref:Putative secreted protein n=1 Tax=Anopheles triannulatus TaxID=58253 RepID=A0A2M3ZZ13_9DIPT